MFVAPHALLYLPSKGSCIAVRWARHEWQAGGTNVGCRGGALKSEQRHLAPQPLGMYAGGCVLSSNIGPPLPPTRQHHQCTTSLVRCCKVLIPSKLLRSYWILKNSWGAGWGKSGYVWFARNAKGNANKPGMCNVGNNLAMPYSKGKPAVSSGAPSYP